MVFNTKSEVFARIDAMGARAPGGNYVPYKQVGELVYLSGQTNGRDGKLTHTGQVGVDVTVEEGYEGARVCMENLLGALKQAVGGDWSKVVECVRLTGYVNSTAPFGQGPAVINGASDLVVELMGDAGRHARSAVGVAALPGNAAVEVEAIFRVKP
jgi:enamine deaminase RidA (YjgF/YER057c/UK114 family)